MNKTTTTTRQIIILNMTIDKTTTTTKTTKLQIDSDNEYDNYACHLFANIRCSSTK